MISSVQPSQTAESFISTQSSTLRDQTVVSDGTESTEEGEAKDDDDDEDEEEDEGEGEEDDEAETHDECEDTVDDVEEDQLPGSEGEALEDVDEDGDAEPVTEPTRGGNRRDALKRSKNWSVKNRVEGSDEKVSASEDCDTGTPRGPTSKDQSHRSASHRRGSATSSSTRSNRRVEVLPSDPLLLDVVTGSVSVTQ